MVFHLGHGANGHPLHVRDSSSPLQHYVYVDNIGVLGLEHDAVEQTWSDIVHEFESHGIPTHEKDIGAHGVEALGVLLDGTLRRTMITAKRFWRVRNGLLHAVRRGRLSGRALEVLVMLLSAACLTDLS
eukprot:14473223-Heterocapsa_arctica.AAC.1